MITGMVPLGAVFAEVRSRASSATRPTIARTSRSDARRRSSQEMRSAARSPLASSSVSIETRVECDFALNPAEFSCVVSMSPQNSSIDDGRAPRLLLHRRSPRVHDVARRGSGLVARQRVVEHLHRGRGGRRGKQPGRVPAEPRHVHGVIDSARHHRFIAGIDRDAGAPHHVTVLHEHRHDVRLTVGLAVGLHLILDQIRLQAALARTAELPAGDALVLDQRAADGIGERRLGRLAHDTLALVRMCGPPLVTGMNSLKPLPHEPGSSAKSFPTIVMLLRISGT